jgi:hypothetical protein
MRLRALAAFPLLYAAAFLALSWELQGSAQLAPFLYWQKIAVRLLAIAGCRAAARCFDRGEHLRLAWLAVGLGTGAILVRDLLRLVPALAAETDPAARLLMAGLAVLSNLLVLAGIGWLARAWKMAAITLPGGRAGFVLLTLLAAALAVAVAGPGALAQARAVAQGDWSALALLASAVVDIVSLCLIAPLLLTAVALRGGLFAWPWGLLTASRLAWLLYDAAATLAPGATSAAAQLPELFRGLGGNYLFVAGVAQYLVIAQVRRATGAPLAPAPSPQSNSTRGAA